jgi:2-oxoisovalerate dehydrogenase E2 component (dihydrolipoyl transacylase)
VSSVKQFNLPDVGEGLTEGEILTWLVQPGDTVVVNQNIVEVETAKAAVELPCPYAGVVTQLFADAGATVEVGSPIIAIETDPDNAAAAAASPTSEPPAQAAASKEDMVPEVPSPEEEGAVEPGLIGGPAPGGRTSVLVGYGPKTTTAKRRPRKGTPAMPGSETPAGLGSAPRSQPAVSPDLPVAPTAQAAPAQARSAPAAPAAAPAPAGPVPTDVKVLAKPPVRKMAKDLGIDLRTVTPTGPQGTITRDDVQDAVSGAGATATPSAAPSGPAWDANREQRIPVKGVRKMTAQAMVDSAFTAPHVTEWVTVDVTRTVELVERLREHRDFRDVKVSPLLVVAKALLLAARRHPEVNASWDEAAQEIVVKGYVNLGIAAATPRGLLVPNVKDADRLTLVELAQALNQLAATARDGKTLPADMQHGTITITNVGVFGVDAGTPILNPGESAILCFGAVRDMPWVVDGEIVPRKVTQLALSFDHRLVDGELGSRFLADVARILEDPAQALLFA